MPLKKKILIVEDEPISVIALRIVLKRLGYDVCAELFSGEDVILSVDQKKPDLVIMDINLAGKIDGIKAAEQIRFKHDIPILFWTGYSDKNVLEKISRIKNSICILKPVAPDEIGQSVEEFLNLI